VEVGGSQFEASVGKIRDRLCLESKLKEKALGVLLKWQSEALSSIPRITKKDLILL
jgi:hypothetical protein